MRGYYSGSNSICANSRYRLIVSLAVFNSDKSSALVINVVTVFCLDNCYMIGPLNSFIKYPCVDLRVSRLSANDTSLDTYSTSLSLVSTSVDYSTEPKNSMAWHFMV